MARIEPASAPRSGGGGDLLLAGRLVCHRCRRTPYPLSVSHTTQLAVSNVFFKIARCSPTRCCSPAAQRSRSAGAASQRCTTAPRRRSWRGRGPMASAGLRGRRSSTRRGSAWCAPPAPAPALCRALASVPLCAKLCYACEVERRTDEHGDVSNTALRVAGVLLAWGVGAVGRSLRGEQRGAGRLGIGAGLTWLRGGAARARWCVNPDTSPPPPPLSALAV